MTYSDQTYNLRIDFDTKHCEFSAREIAKLEQGLSPLRKPVEKFPVSDLYLVIERFLRSNDYKVKLSLRLPGRTLTTGDAGPDYYPAFERGVRKMVHKVTAYRGTLSDEEETHKHGRGTKHGVLPTQELDPLELKATIDNGDYGHFRTLLLPYEESVRKRIGRWITRHPALEAQLDDRFSLADVVEEVFLNAFERFEHRSQQVPLGDWLENLIDPSLKLLNEHPDEELQNISFARSLHEWD